MNSFQRMTGASLGMRLIFRPSVSMYPALMGVDRASFTLAMMMLTTLVFSRTFSNLL